MRRTSSALAALALVLGIASVAYAANPPAGEPREGKPPPIATYRVNAIGGSGQHGTVTLKQLSPTQTQVTIALTGEPSTASEPAHIKYKDWTP